ncbi:carbohydrate kinase [Flaviramulus aquimarinus]|uniref:Carbohydrate kinase n=1 Tax=Flaviramulus aquimarinus TaxID=1170456 RepID=A0ABP9ERJ1_9FLAO
MSNIVCFGEVLWDMFPTHKKIGGAPLNVALRLNSFGHNVKMISAIGNDENGKALIQHIHETGLDTVTYIQRLIDYKTGDVKVTLNNKGSATYDIMYPRAWDKIELNEMSKDIVSKSNAFVFGSLITRDEVSKSTLYSLIDNASYNIFDLNLRAPYYTKSILTHLMEKADFIKFNDDELYEVASFLNSKYDSLEDNLEYISEQTNTDHICVTRGEHGAVLLYNNALYYNNGYQIKVKDTVGAGDSFLGALISQLLSNVEPQKAINFACGVGALVAQSEGANPKLSLSEINTFINP